MGTALLIEPTPAGLYCAAGDFYIDPWCPVDRAVVTHAHSDHARPGSRRYLGARPGLGLLRDRLGPDADIEALDYAAPLTINGVRVSLHPAGHVLGSAQVRIEHGGAIAVVAGDYKDQPDATCAPLEPLRCDYFVTEATFALPIYRWPPAAEVLADINTWWRANQARGWTSVLFGYSIGKSQRVLAGLDPSLGPILAHGAVRRYLPAYEQAGVRLPPVEPADDDIAAATRGRAIVLAPPSALGSPWLRKFGEYATAFASGWMQLRGPRRWRSVDRGFVLSDHADWPGLLATIRATGAVHIGVTHGYTQPLARWLREQGYTATELPTQFGDEEEGGPGPQPRAGAESEHAGRAGRGQRKGAPSNRAEDSPARTRSPAQASDPARIEMPEPADQSPRGAEDCP